MATQFVCLASFQPRKRSKKQFTHETAISHDGETVVTKLLPKNDIHDRQQISSSHTQYKAINGTVKLGNGSSSTTTTGDDKEEIMNKPYNKLQKRKKKGRRGWAREFPRYLGLWYMSSSISYILRKARAFYNEFCCDHYFDDSLNIVIGHDQLMLADPYFSLPVIPPIM